MKLEEVIKYLKDTDELLKFFQINQLNLDSEEISVYMKDEISVDSELFFFEVEETDGKVIYNRNGETFIYFFPLEHFSSLFEELDLLEAGLTDLQIANRLVEYRIKDA